MISPDPEIRKSICVVPSDANPRSGISFVARYGKTAISARNHPPKRLSLSDTF